MFLNFRNSLWNRFLLELFVASAFSLISVCSVLPNRRGNLLMF
uniref:Uncharacterized protein n=1 Tax=Tetraselmis sp. GSL018 TaxID=582737 RepID=A0A061S197_9CHLO